MSHRAGKEFGTATLEYAFRKSEDKCQSCGSQEKLQAHHIAALWYVAEYFPQLTSWILKSPENCQILCYECHDKLHRLNDLSIFEAQALLLLFLQGTELL